uniref:EGF-like domain-containing protein n=1 Tax=Parastrongyloides trichosuri TaxID=131310 RepID=A0A0N4ZWG1_PARTI
MKIFWIYLISILLCLLNPISNLNSTNNHSEIVMTGNITEFVKDIVIITLPDSTERPYPMTKKQYPTPIINTCPEDYHSPIKCNNGGIAKCKFWKNKIIGIPYCKCTEDYAGQFCDYPRTIAFLKMTASSPFIKYRFFFEYILPCIIICISLSLIFYLFVFKRDYN